MGKVKIKKKSTWIDMTPMSDVMVLLLTFFMLTSTFVKNEPVKVVTPGSVSEIKVPEKDIHEYGQPKRHARRAPRHERTLWNEIHSSTGE